MSRHSDLGALLDALPSAVIYTDERARIQECNRKACEWFGYPREEMVGRSVSDLFWTPPARMDLLVDPIEILWLGKGGEVFPAEVSRHRLDDDDRGYLWLLSRETGRRAERAAESRAETRESERLRLARELHDGPIQDLLAIGFGLGALQPQSPEPDDPIRVQQQALMGVVRQLRALVSELRPAGLDEFGLEASLEGLLAKLLRLHGGAIPPALDLKLESLPELSLPQQLCIYRGAQEAVINCLRHAQASRIKVRLGRVGPAAELCVEDDGCGFQAPASLSELTRSQRYGLAGIAERAQQLDGSLSIKSEPGRGTQIRLTLPIQPA